MSVATPRIVAIDTTSEFGSIAIAEGERIVEEVALQAKDGFSPIIFPALRDLLAAHSWPLDSVDCFAGAAGPGSFTGVRVGLTAVKGLAEACGKPAMGVSNLQALAAHASGSVRAVWLDARRGEVYGGVYDERLLPLVGEIVAPMERWLTSLPAGASVLDGTGRLLAAPIALIAAQRYCDGERPDPAGVDANYVRRSDAELFWKDGAS